MSSNLVVENNVRENYMNCLAQQLCEYEVLKSIYPAPSDILLTDKNIINDINNFLAKKSEFIPSHLDFIINLVINNLKLEVSVNLPSCYPNEEPDLHVRCNQLNRLQESELNTELSEYIKENHIFGEVCLYSAISWLQENIDRLSSKIVGDMPCERIFNENIETLNHPNFVRMWIFSHHIYNKKKREEICKKAKELKLTGFCLSGKPGIICIEGENQACQEWWKDIKSMCWKKIMIRKTEALKSFEDDKKFLNFEEINKNMSEFSKYMQDLGFSQIFNEIFGFGNE